MNSTLPKILVLSLAIATNLSKSQSIGNVFRGFGIELGGGQNNLFWSAPFNIRTLGGVPHDRTHFSLTANVRLNYRVELTEAIAVLPFVGYNRFGGSSDPEEGMQDWYSFDALDIGSFVLVGFSSVQVGAGIKINRHLGVRYHFVYTDQTVVDGDRSGWFTEWSEDAGVRLTYAFAPFSISGEGWFGLSNLANIGAGARIHQNHYRLLLGYTL